MKITEILVSCWLMMNVGTYRPRVWAGLTTWGFVLLLGFSGLANDRWPLADSVQVQDTLALETVDVHAFLVRQSLHRTTAAAAVLGPSVLADHASERLLSALNTVPGLRMEERSPGSYRLSIRGSLLRSPFGVRNVKIYLDQIPLTDAGGNTYLNLVDPGALIGIEVLKGPDGSLFGANSGGVIVLRTPTRASPGTQFGLRRGAFGSLHQQGGMNVHLTDTYQTSMYQSYHRSDGYRDHAAIQRHYLQTQHRWRYHPDRRNELRVLAAYGDLDYQTPGGLTKAQAAANPRAARPSSGPVPGAVEQQAGIHNRTGLVALLHDWFPRPDLQHVAAVFGSDTDFRNPFITNYETRFERNIGGRTYAAYQSDPTAGNWRLRAQIGTEWQGGRYTIYNYDNLGGQPGTLQSADQIGVLSGTSFLRLEADFWQRLLLEAAISHNRYLHRFRKPLPDRASAPDPISFSIHPSPSYFIPSEWMPRFAFSYRPSFAFWTWRGVVSRGFSPPTTAEIRASDQIVNTQLRAETGWNLETGFRYQLGRPVFFADVTAFRYTLRDGLVRSTREDGTEFFQNVGRIRQWGLEVMTRAALTPYLRWSGSWAWSHFVFHQYTLRGQDYAGNMLTGVPKHALSNDIQVSFPIGWELLVTHHYVSRIPLDDANTEFADAYHLLSFKLSRSWNWGRKAHQLRIFFSGDNLLNQRYSLGNDLNAFGGRYFNPAADRSFTFGFSHQFCD